MNFKLKAGAFAPIRAHKQDAGVDLLSPVTVTIYPGDSATIDTGVCAEIPELIFYSLMFRAQNYPDKTLAHL